MSLRDRLPFLARASSPAPAGYAVLLTEVRAALAAGAAPGPALAAGVERSPARSGPIAPVAQAVRLGRSLADAARTVDTGDVTLDLLLRALGVAERCGAGGLAAVDQALAAATEEAETARRLRARTAQARGTARLLTALPIAAWLLFVAFDSATLGFYTTTPGVVTGLIAVILAVAGHRWSRRIVARAGRAAWQVDPLWPPSLPPDVGRALTLALPAVAIVGLGAGLMPGIVAGAVLGLVGLRPATPSDLPDLSRGGGAEAVELVTVALACGQAPAAAVAAVAPLAPPAARPALNEGARRLGGGWAPAPAFADGGLAAMGEALAASERWGAPCEPALRRLAAELRHDRRAAAEEAAERTQLSLVFPTTLLTLPAFVVGVVPPLLWTAFTGAFG